MDDDDDFGDASFLDNFDVDAAVEAERKKRLSDATFVGSKNNNDENQPFNQSNAETACQQPKGESLSKRQRPSSDVFLACLQEYFGYSSFRSGQLEVIETIAVEQRDCAVFWATGKGKSLCYQIPALVSQHGCGQEQVVVVVSPLVSLMQDQVHKINGLSETMLANYLGSGQSDDSVESRALRGEFCLLYVTPEKLASGNFLERLARMHATRKPVSLFAIDEAHCVSEWGHDFRPEFRKIGSALRGDQSSALSQVPILSLTATAVPQVQQDIMSSLKLRNPYKALESFDRSNLKIKVNKKRGSVLTALTPLISSINSTTRKSQQSTIVYAATRKSVEEIVEVLQKKVHPVSVQGYHAGMSSSQRHAAHINFLTGRTTVIVATVAFGMGIDKPDTRRVVHYGPPKTMEEYYQQIGRAGRDGLTSECIMLFTDADFDKYNSEFYLGNLHGKALEATKSSMNALRTYAMNITNCRRRTLVKYFGQEPSFGDYCGTCDNCQKRETYGGDLDRDFGGIGARQLLVAVGALNSQSSTYILDVVMGKLVADYRYKSSKLELQKKMKLMLNEIPQHYPKQQYFKELLRVLVEKRMINESSRTSNVNGRSNTYKVFALSPQGANLRFSKDPIVLPVPDCIREADEKEKATREETIAKLKQSGLNVPQDEMAKGGGPAIQAMKKWVDYVQFQHDSNRHERVSQLESLVKILEDWRSSTAFMNLTATGSVMSEQTLVSVAYTQATLPPGRKLDTNSLVAAGVRSKEISSLVKSLSDWVDQHQRQPEVPTGASADLSMSFPEAGIQADSPWEFAVYKKQRGSDKASWESSFERFMKGESPQSIAINPSKGRPIQAKTVVGHVLDGLTHGRKVDARRLVDIIPAPTKTEWQKLEEAEATTNMSVTMNPDTSGVNGERFSMTCFLTPIVGQAVAEKKSPERSDAEKSLMGKWFDNLKWYMALRRINYKPAFESK